VKAEVIALANSAVISYPLFGTSTAPTVGAKAKVFSSDLPVRTTWSLRQQPASSAEFDYQSELLTLFRAGKSHLTPVS
jgi:hypothetical protein